MKGVRDAAIENGVVLLEAVADNDPQLQNSQIQSFVAQKVDVIMIVAVDMEAIKTGIQAAEEAGVPVVTFDRKVPDEPYVSYHSGLDSYADGYACGKYMAGLYSAYPNKPGVVLELLGALNDDNAIQRRDGFEQGLKEGGATDITVNQAPMNWDAAQALAATEDAFAANVDIWAVQLPHDGAMEAVMTALQGAGRYFKAGEPGHVVTCAIDGSEPGYLATTEGYNDALVVLPLFQVGRAALENAMLVANGGTPAQTDERFAGDLYTWENIVEHTDEIWGVAPLD
jgi:ABC-type sugar transport system substrate-binding protein